MIIERRADENSREESEPLRQIAVRSIEQPASECRLTPKMANDQISGPVDKR